MAHYSKTLVVDFDDTLAITLNRDWANAKPNILLIEKLNQLFDEGWTIHIVTARGQLSCQGDCEAADRKYRQQIENWLYENQVKYTDLSFQKKLAVYYIDDKGITPEDFIKTFNRIPLKGGMSGSDVYYDEAADAVFKTAKNTASAVAWYEVAKHYVNIPMIHSVIGDTIKMERLSEYKGSVIRILEECRTFRDIPPLHPGLLRSRYVDRCLHRIKDELANELDFKLLDDILTYASEVVPATFSHGDMSISNIMSGPSGQTVYFIDPINDPTLLSSWVIDIAKLYMSIGFEFGDDDERRKLIEQFCSLHDVNLDAVKAHEIGHYCRVYPYADSDKKKIILEKLKDKCRYFNGLRNETVINHILTANVPQQKSNS
jgi:capsule biosynthesis phosphatase